MKLRYPANETHKRYGFEDMPLFYLCGKSYYHKQNQHPENCKPNKGKKIHLKVEEEYRPKEIKKSCTAKTARADFLFSEPEVKIMYAEIAMRIYSTVHTIGNKNPGGERDGFAKI